MSEPAQYIIRTVHDFAKVPEDRREVCLREFQVWVVMMEGVAVMMEGIGVRPPEAFVWIDDDKHEIDVSVESDEDRVLIVSGRMKGFSP